MVKLIFSPGAGHNSPSHENCRNTGGGGIPPTREFSGQLCPQLPTRLGQKKNWPPFLPLLSVKLPHHFSISRGPATTFFPASSSLGWSSETNVGPAWRTPQGSWSPWTASRRRTSSCGTGARCGPPSPARQTTSWWAKGRDPLGAVQCLDLLKPFPFASFPIPTGRRITVSTTARIRT